MAPNIDEMLGAIIIGSTISTLMYGITCLQTYIYFNHSNDGVSLKATVIALCVLDTFHTIALTHAVYHYSVTHFGNYRVLAKTTWGVQLSIVIGALMACIAQGFFASRIYRLGRKKWLIPLIILLLSAAQLGCAIDFTTQGFLRPYFDMARKDRSAPVTALGISIANDSMIAATMIYYLRRERTEFNSTNKVIGTLISYAMNTCLLTNLCTTATLVLLVRMADTLVHAPFYFVTCKLYVNSTLSALNSRRSMQDRMDRSGTMISLSTQMDFGTRAADTNGTCTDSKFELPEVGGLGSAAQDV